MATVPTPLDPAPGDINSATKFDAGVRDALAWTLTNRPMVHAYDGVGVSMASGTDTLLLLNSEVFDNDNMHSTTVNTSRITFNTAGMYDIRIIVVMASATYTTLNLNTRVNSAESNTGGTGLGSFLQNAGRFAQVHFFYRFSAGDHLQTWVNQASGGGAQLTAPGALRTCTQALWVSN